MIVGKGKKRIQAQTIQVMSKDLEKGDVVNYSGS